MDSKPFTVGQKALAIGLSITEIILILNHAWLFILLLIPYVAPTLIAAFHTRKKDWGYICCFNLGLGLTGIGWIIALVWALIPDKEDRLRSSPEGINLLELRDRQEEEQAGRETGPGQYI
jgi:Superinfection immunity protein